MTRTSIIRYERRCPPRSLIRRLVQELGRRRLAVVPTETQYALTADGTSKFAIRRVREIKGRADRQPFSVFLANSQSLADWNIVMPAWARPLADVFWPGPLTLILPTGNSVFSPLGATGAVGVRVSPEPLVNALVEGMQRPLLATSANPSGVILSPYAENAWLTEGASAGHYLWARPERFMRREASTILDCCGGRAKLIRAGGIPTAKWMRVLREGRAPEK